jgi:hypothetical protein
MVLFRISLSIDAYFIQRSKRRESLASLGLIQLVTTYQLPTHIGGNSDCVLPTVSRVGAVAPVVQFSAPVCRDSLDRGLAVWVQTCKIARRMDVRYTYRKMKNKRIKWEVKRVEAKNTGTGQLPQASRY